MNKGLIILLIGIILIGNVSATQYFSYNQKVETSYKNSDKWTYIEDTTGSKRGFILTHEWTNPVTMKEVVVIKDDGKGSSVNTGKAQAVNTGSAFSGTLTNNKNNYLNANGGTVPRGAGITNTNTNNLVSYGAINQAMITYRNSNYYGNYRRYDGSNDYGYHTWGSFNL